MSMRLVYEFTAMNYEQRLIALVGCKTGDVACHNGFARACGQDVDR